MKRRLLYVLPLLVAGVVVALLLTSGSDDDDSPSGVIDKQLARSIPLDVTRATFDSQIGQPPVKVERQRAGRRTFSLKGLTGAAKRKYRRQYGNRKVVVFPPETFTCLLYHGTADKTYAWRFCFGADGKLDAVSTAPPISG